MRAIRDMLRLHFREGYSKRKIAGRQSLGVKLPQATRRKGVQTSLSVL